MFKRLTVLAAALAVAAGLVPGVSAASAAPASALVPHAQTAGFHAQRVDAREDQAESLRGGERTLTVRDTPKLAVVGVTWRGDRRVAVDMRTKTNGRWGQWERITEDEQDEDALDTANPRVRGTEAQIVTDAEDVQARVIAAAGAAISKPKLTVIDSRVAAQDRAVSAPQRSATTVEPGLTIHSRAEWGADESLLDWPPRYAPALKGIVVHHTDGSNNYTADQVPAILRSIYYFHAVTRDWGDIGYNFLVDRFGRVWQGRAGDIYQLGIGAHARGSNDGTVGISVMGTYDDTPPSAAAINAVERVAEWKLSAWGRSVDSTMTTHGHIRGHDSLTTPALSGHRDVGMTDCPGQAFYDQLPRMRADIRAMQSKRVHSPVFSDVAADAPFVADIRWVKGRGFLRGWPNGDFGPSLSLERVAMAALLYRAAGSPAVALPARSPFKDVAPGSQFYREVVWLSRSGITTGWPDGTFRPNQPVSREAMAAFMYRFGHGQTMAKLYPASPALRAGHHRTFTDVGSTPFKREVQWLGDHDVSTGWPDHTFRPHLPIERQAIAAFLHRFLRPRALPAAATTCLHLATRAETLRPSVTLGCWLVGSRGVAVAS